MNSADPKDLLNKFTELKREFEVLIKMCGNDIFPPKPRVKYDKVPKIDLSNLGSNNQRRRIEDIGKDLTPIPNKREENDSDSDSHGSLLDDNPRTEHKKKSLLAIVSKRSAHWSKKKIIPVKIQTHKTFKNSFKSKDEWSYRNKHFDKGN